MTVVESPDRQARRRTLGRIASFTDGAAAIALTLLALPLVDEAADTGQTVGRLLIDERDSIIAFVVSFWVIAQFWAGHRRVFELLDDYDETLLLFNTLWLLAIVFLPVPTALLTLQGQASASTAVFYSATVLGVSVTLFLLAVWIYRHPALQRDGMAERSRRGCWRSLSVVLVLAVATVLAWWLGAYALFLLFLQPLVQRVLDRVVR